VLIPVRLLLFRLGAAQDDRDDGTSLTVLNAYCTGATPPLSIGMSPFDALTASP